MTDELTTLEEIKAHLLVEHAEDDDFLRQLHLAAEARFRTFCGERPIVAAVATEYHDGGRRKLFLRRYPIHPTASLVVTDTRGTQDTSDDEVVEATYYRVYYERGVLVRTDAHGTPRFWPEGARRYKVVYTGGLNQLDDWGQVHRPVITQGVKLLVAAWYDVASSATDKPGEVRRLLDASLPPAVEALWASYKPLRV